MKSWGVSVLDEHHPFFTHITPFSSYSTAEKQVVDITVSVRLRLYEARVLLGGQLGSVIDQSRHILLLHDFDLLLLHAKEVIALKKSNSAIVSIIGDHDSEGNDEVVTKGRIDLFGSLLAGQSIVTVEFQIRVIFFDCADW